MKNLKTIFKITLLTLFFSLSACSEKKEEIKEPQGYLMVSFTVPSNSKKDAEQGIRKKIKEVFEKPSNKVSVPQKKKYKGLERVLKIIFPDLFPKKEKSWEYIPKRANN